MSSIKESGTGSVRHLLCIRNADQLVSVCSEGERSVCASAANRVRMLSRRADGVGCACVVNERGKFEFIGFDDQLTPGAWENAVEHVDARGYCLLPGLVDAHTHAQFAGNRFNELEWRAQGRSYLEIHKEGGGIYSTVAATRAATVEELKSSLVEVLEAMLSNGSTVVEVKTGYGLDYANELKMLQVLHQVKKTISAPEVVITFCGAHAVPPGQSPEEGCSSVLEMMRRLADEHPELPVDFVDCFCERGVYNVEQTRRLLLSGRQLLNAEISFHGDEFAEMNAAELAAQMQVKAISHLERISDAGIEAMASTGTVAILCPTTALVHKLPPPPVRRMMSAGVPVALASDYNASSGCYSLPAAWSVAQSLFAMTPNECLIASTINAAAALSCSHRCGSIEVGKNGDLLMVQGTDWRILAFQFADAAALIKRVYKNGRRVR